MRNKQCGLQQQCLFPNFCKLNQASNWLGEFIIFSKTIVLYFKVFIF